MIAAIEVYTKEELGALLLDTSVTGIIVGDFFCNLRMFPYGEVEITSVMQTIKSNGKNCYFQTPYYMTDDTLQKTLSDIRYWNKENLIDGVFVQDVGCFALLYKEFPNLKYIYSCMGASRNGALNHLQFESLAAIGNIIFTTDNEDHYKILQEYGFSVMLQFGNLNYASINRLCYYKYEKGIYGEDCCRKCLSDLMYMKNDKFHMRMSVDGFLLGKRYDYRPGILPVDICYAKNYSELTDALKNR